MAPNKTTNVQLLPRNTGYDIVQMCGTTVGGSIRPSCHMPLSTPTTGGGGIPVLIRTARVRVDY